VQAVRGGRAQAVGRAPARSPSASRTNYAPAMTRIVAAPAAAVLALALAACGSSSKPTTKTSVRAAPSTSAPSTSAPSTSAPSTSSVAITTESSPYGTILADGAGYTLYVFSADTTPGKSACTGACKAVWPPLVAPATPSYGPGVDTALVGTITRPSGTRQLTYAGHPLYTFVHDTAPHQTHGEGIVHFGGTWMVITAAGKPVSPPAAPSASTTTTTASGYGAGGGY
jgi:predicted lipoprotein with Yx(FWY)xxD motif